MIHKDFARIALSLGIETSRATQAEIRLLHRMFWAEVLSDMESNQAMVNRNHHKRKALSC